MAKLKIVHILPSLRTGGAEVFTVNLLRAFDSQRFKCSLITLYSVEKNNRLLQKLREVHIDYFSLNKGPGFEPKIALPLHLLLKKIKPDIIHTHMYAMKYVLFSQLGSALPPWVHTIQNLAHKEMSYPDRKLAALLYRLQKVKPVAVSYAVQSSCKTYYHMANVKVIHNSIPCDANTKRSKFYYRRDLSLPSAGTMIVSVARLVPQKNHFLLLDAFNILQQVCRNCFLVFVGDGPLRDNLKERVRQLNITKKIFFPGEVIEPEPYLKAADIFTLSSNHEGLPLSMLEAMKAGLPVVATKAGGIPEAVDDSLNGYLVDIGDTQDFASSLIKMVRSKKLKAFGSRARKKVLTEFNIRNATLQYEKIYEELLSSK
jgi:glycosyltransferase involved in cell wall biosynthesis